MPLLVKQGWIVMERHLFKNKVTPFISLTIKSSRLVANATNPLVSNDTKLIDCTDTTTETTTKIVLANRGSRSAKGESTGRRGRGGRKEVGESTDRRERTVIKRGWMMKAADILKAHQAPTTGSLGAYWKSRCALVEKGYQKPLTGKEAGQLKLLSNYLGDQTRPVIAYAVEHWWKFASRAGAAAGTSFPADPNIGFLLKHHAVAVNLLTPEGTHVSANGVGDSGSAISCHCRDGRGSRPYAHVSGVDGVAGWPQISVRSQS